MRYKERKYLICSRDTISLINRHWDLKDVTSVGVIGRWSNFFSAQLSENNKKELCIIARDLPLKIRGMIYFCLFPSCVSSLTVTSLGNWPKLHGRFPVTDNARVYTRYLVTMAFDAYKPRAIKLAFDKAVLLNKWLIRLRNITSLSPRATVVVPPSSKRVSPPIPRSRSPDRWYDTIESVPILRDWFSRLDRQTPTIRYSDGIVCTQFLCCIMATVHQSWPYPLTLPL